MAFVDIHTGIPTSPKHATLSDGAFRLWVHALCWSKEHLTDGFIPSAMLAALHPRGPKLAAELLASVVPGKGPLWHAVEHGYQIHDYSAWQETKARVQSRRQTWREKKAGQRGGQQKESPSVSTGDTPMDSPVDSRVSPLRPPSDVLGHGVPRSSVPSDLGPSSLRSEGSASATKRPNPDPLFERFYAAYPRKVSRGDAEKAFRRLKADEALLQQMLDALAWQVPHFGWGKGNSFTPYPASWINDRRWEDERPEADQDAEADEVDPRFDTTRPYVPPTTRAPRGW